MIGLAVIEQLAREIGGTVGEQWFYENLPIDENGAMSNFGVYVITNSAPMQQNGDFHNFLEFDVAIGEGAIDPTTGEPVAEKFATDELVDKIQVAIRDWLDHPENHCRLAATGPGGETLTFRDVRLYPAMSKMRAQTLSNGAIVKFITAEVYYK